MLVSLNWLKEFVAIPKNISPTKLGELLTMHTVEVEDVIEQGKDLEKIIVGQIKALRQHPNADRLRIATVSDGKRQYQVVCGGSNLYEGMLVAFATVGARVKWHGEGELVTLEPAVIRSETSEGMICAAEEIGLENLFPSADEKAVVDLKGLATGKQTGKLLADALGLNDVIYDIDNKSMTHRPDLWSHYGMARDISAFLPAKLKPLAVRPLPRPQGNGKKLAVTVKDTKLCSRYVAVRIDGLEVKPSPSWLQQRLLACGLRPINNIVDITNYVMLETGQPTHAFDAGRLGNRIVVRTAAKGERMATLDGQKRKLDEKMLVITDGKVPVAIAGVMGGEDSEVGEATTSIIVEAATFDAVSVRTTAQRLGLRTEASARFEKSLDPALSEVAVKRIFQLLKESCPGVVIGSPVADVKRPQSKPKAISVDADWLNERLGEAVPVATAKTVLKRLGFTVGGNTKRLAVTPPSWRATKDVSIPEDIVEEVARIHGFGNITPSYPLVPMRAPAANPLRSFTHAVKDVLAGSARLHETISPAFTNEAQLEKAGLDPAGHIRIANPISSDCTLLRSSLIPNLLEQVIINQRQYDRIGLFETGSVFWRKDGEWPMGSSGRDVLPQQPLHLGIVHNGADGEQAFFALKGAVQLVAAAWAGEIRYRFMEGTMPGFAEPATCADIIIKDSAVGYAAIINEQTAKRIGLKTPTAIAEIDIARLRAALSDVPAVQYATKPQYPEVRRDIAFVVNEKIVYNEIVETVRAASARVEMIEPFDIYRGENIGSGSKSIAIHLALRDPQKTLSSEEADTEIKTIVAALEKKLQAKLRDS